MAELKPPSMGLKRGSNTWDMHQFELVLVNGKETVKSTTIRVRNIFPDVTDGLYMKESKR